jgi:phosphate transport system substrate-binding protein
MLIKSIFASALLLMATACVKSPDAPREKLLITGSSTVAPLVGEIARRFEQKNPNVRIDVQTGGSSRGIADVRRSTANIGMVSRALKAPEADLRGVAIARDGIAILVHKDNPVNELSVAQITAVYRGEFSNWKQIGGVDAPITVVSKAEGRSTLELFLEHFKLKAEEIKSSVIIGDNQQGIITVAGNPHAVAYVSIGAALEEQSRGVGIKLLPLGGVAPTLQNLGNGSFPLSRPLTLVIKGEPTPLMRTFLDYARGAAVHDLLKKQHFVPFSN